MPAKRDQFGDLEPRYRDRADNLGNYAKPYLAPERRRVITSISIRPDERDLIAMLAPQDEESAWHPSRARVTTAGELVKVTARGVRPLPKGNLSRGVSVLLERFAAAVELLNGLTCDSVTARQITLFLDTVPEAYLDKVLPSTEWDTPPPEGEE